MTLSNEKKMNLPKRRIEELNLHSTTCTRRQWVEKKKKWWKMGIKWYWILFANEIVKNCIDKRSSLTLLDDDGDMHFKSSGRLWKFLFRFYIHPCVMVSNFEWNRIECYFHNTAKKAPLESMSRHVSVFFYLPTKIKHEKIPQYKHWAELDDNVHQVAHCCYLDRQFIPTVCVCDDDSDDSITM